ncbi:glucosaminidase domain-containing protein [Lutibacter sp.]|uniref:glucosaminidase domain-containing protein n=1 Tax=Lutibacter sp. TaxID=1925666 RepID=UPI0025C2F8F7|nr:glucosaminidase domain-containing protein [Lutibacter sp.]MCF6167120.1 glucosaminidase domain-containing protein [Lutibacter sp.]
MKLKYILICLLTISFLVGCKSKKKLARKSQKEIAVHQKANKPTSVNTKKNSAITNSTIEYIKRYKDIAMEEMRVFKIPASITLAQGILESSSGNSLLTKKSNNHFGIKCHKGWKGKKVYHDDDEKGECFRVYKHPNNSFKDHSKFLATRNRYAKLFKLRKGDYVKWAKGLSEAGYATDRRYPAKLIALIEKYDLHKYDTEVLGKPFKKLKIKNVSNHIVSKGDTLYSISKKYGLTVDELKKMNGLNSNDITVGQTLILK